MVRQLSGILLTFLAIFTAAPAFASNHPPGCIVYPSDGNIEWKCLRLKKGETLEKLFGESWKDAARFNRIDRRHARAGAYIRVPERISEIKDFSPMPGFYSEAQSIPRYILIDISEQFLGAYEYGNLVFSAPAATGEEGNETPYGEFRITAFSRDHKSSKYLMEKTTLPYPMHYALRFHISRDGISYWIHGRDLPGRPASHGCVGLYDEEMQKKYYKYPPDPSLEDARTLYEWAIGESPDDGKLHSLKDGPTVRIIGSLPEEHVLPGRPAESLKPLRNPFSPR